MSDDLHTNVVLAALTEPLKAMNDLLHTRKVHVFVLSVGGPVNLSHRSTIPFPILFFAGEEAGTSH